jgi:Reverse transcriptase (RNA-dependent DNA polymerase)
MKKKPSLPKRAPAKSDKPLKAAPTAAAKAPAPQPPKIAPSLKAAIQNIATFGDTDIFPFSFEQHIFHDRPDLLQEALERLHTDFDAELAKNPPDNINTLAPVGYTGFRWAAQIDPLWNAYYLALVLEMGPAIEQARIPVSEKSVFSYRFITPKADGRIFDENVNWRAFMETSYGVAEEAAKKAAERKAARKAGKEEASEDTNESPYVILCDISDFYSRIYHHRVENALKWLNAKPDVVKRIVEVLQVFSDTVSYGLPVGGPASRLLAEISLNSVDKLLRGEGIRFCRFADDYRIFCDSKEEAYQRLIFLSEKLFNEGLSLQKTKTRILTAKEFMDESKLLMKFNQAEEGNVTEEEKLLRIAIHFDPYSDTRVDDYEKLKEQVSQVDIAGILGRELEKTRIDPTITKQAISALLVIEPEQRKSILSSLLKPENLHTLAPVFSRLMTVLRGLYLDLDSATQDLVDGALIGLVEKGSHIIKIDLNLAYLVQVLRRRCSPQTETLFVKLFRSNSNPLVRREIILAWIAWRNNHSLTDLKKHFKALSKWERRAFIVGSYILTDEGKHWRKHNDDSFDPGEVVVREWFADRFNKNPDTPL